MRTLLEDGILKAAQGLTTLEDVVRVVAADDSAAHKDEATKPGATPISALRGRAAIVQEEREEQAIPSAVAGVINEAIYVPNDQSLLAAREGEKLGNTREKARVLVVEDSATIASVVKYFLELEGFEVLVAKDGTSGLEAAKRDPPQVIVTDYNMPGMDGMTMVKALRAEAATRDIAVLMLTSEQGVEKEAQALEAGVDDYILKPVEPRRLAARVRSVLARSQRRNPAAVQ